MAIRPRWGFSLFIACLLLASSWPALAQDVQDWTAQDADAAAVLAAVAGPQASYYGVAGRYLQTLSSGPPPADGATLPPSLTNKPSDVPLTLADIGAPIPSDLTIAFEIHEYSGPYGVGYVVYSYAEKEKQVYVRADHLGADPAFASHGWQLVAEAIK